MNKRKNFDEYPAERIAYGKHPYGIGAYRFDHDFKPVEFWLDYEVATDKEKQLYREYLEANGWIDEYVENEYVDKNKVELKALEDRERLRIAARNALKMIEDDKNNFVDAVNLLLKVGAEVYPELKNDVDKAIALTPRKELKERKVNVIMRLWQRFTTLISIVKLKLSRQKT